MEQWSRPWAPARSAGWVALKFLLNWGTVPIARGLMKTLALPALGRAACSGGMTPPPGPPAPETKSYSLKSFTLQPGEELINCYYVPADGVERYISKFTTDMN